MDFLEALKTLIEYGIAFAVMGSVIAAFLTDVLTTAKSRDREITRERALTDKAMDQVSDLTQAMKETNDAWERRNEIEAARDEARTYRGS